jgi:hypothetical protein
MPSTGTASIEQDFMAERSQAITAESLAGLFRHHPYLLLLQKEDWSEYLQLLANIYDVLEDQGARMPIEVVRSLALRFYAFKGLVAPEQKVAYFLSMAIGELQVLKDSHDQFGQRFIETTRAGKSLLQLIENLLSQRSKFSGTNAESMLGSLNDVLIGRQQMTLDEAVHHHKGKIDSYKEDLTRLKRDGLSAAQLLPIAHSNEALFGQAEDAALHVLQSIEDVKDAIETQRKDLADGYFNSRRSAGETLGAVADFYERLYASPEYASYVQAKELLSHLDGFERRFAFRNIDKLLNTIETRELLPRELVKKSNLRPFGHQFAVADTAIQEKIKAQIRILQQQVLYAISTDVEGLRSSLHDLLANLVGTSLGTLEFTTENPVLLKLRPEMPLGEVELFDFTIPAEITPEELQEEGFDLDLERELFLQLIRAEEGTLREILEQLEVHMKQNEVLDVAAYDFPRGLAEYYVLSEIELFSELFGKSLEGELADLRITSKYGQFILRQVPAFTIHRRLEAQVNGSTH